MPAGRLAAVDLLLGILAGFPIISRVHARTRQDIGRPHGQAQFFIEAALACPLQRVHFPIPTLLCRFLLERRQVVFDALAGSLRFAQRINPTTARTDPVRVAPGRRILVEQHGAGGKFDQALVEDLLKERTIDRGHELGCKTTLLRRQSAPDFEQGRAC
ncbi:hypothetical protein D9M69_487040 [compost metagenome]